MHIEHRGLIYEGKLVAIIPAWTQPTREDVERYYGLNWTDPKYRQAMKPQTVQRFVLKRVGIRQGYFVISDMKGTTIKEVI